MGDDDGLTVLYVSESEPQADTDVVESLLSDVEVEPVSPTLALESLQAQNVVCLVVGRDLSRSAVGSLLSTVRGVAPSLPVVFCAAEQPLSIPEAARSDGIVRCVSVQATPFAKELGTTIDDVLPDNPRFPPAAAGDYRQLFESAPVPIVLYEADGRLVFANEATADLLGAENPNDILDCHVTEFVPDSELPDVERRMNRVLDDRKAVGPHEVKIETTDGDIRQTEVTTVPVTYRDDPAGQVVINDLTDYHRRQTELQRERDRLGALFESVPEPLVHVRFEEGEALVRNVNAAFEETFGYDRETLLGAPVNDYIVTPDSQVEANKLDRQGMEQEEIEAEITRQTPDGPREFLFQGITFEGEDGTVEGIATYVDITEQKQRQRELERQNERLEAFANIVSHDLRNPLNVIGGRLELAQQTGDEEHFDAIERAAERMETLIDELLRLARQGDTVDDLSELELGATIESAWTTVETGDATLITENAVGTIEADSNRFPQVLENLFRNAIEHGGEGVTVWVGRFEDGIYVEDDGSGIPESERDSVFDIGYTTADTGTGYGLAIVEEIVAAHDWDISVTEGRAGGARFEIIT